MKKYFLSCFLFSFIFLIEKKASAQYPTIPPALEDSEAVEMRKFKTLSDEAFAKALPIIEGDEKKGKPFILWAAKSNDLPQASIPAFPGAEGGGAFKNRK